MQTIRGRLSLLLALAALSSVAHSQIQLPSVPVGGVLGARVTLSQLGGSAIAGVPVELSIVGNCGTFQGGATTTSVVTDASGGFLFTFIPRDVPGNCTIQGRNGNVVGSAYTNIYRPADLTIATFPDQGYVIPFLAGTGNATMRFAVNANGSAVYGLTVSIDPPVTLAGSGAPPVLTPTSFTTNTSGQVTYQAALPGNVGVWDYTMHAAGTQRTFRIQQQGATTTALARSKVASDELSDIHGATLVSIVNAPASCMLRDVVRAQTTSKAPTGTTDFPLGIISLRITGCPAGATLTLKAEYATALPIDSAVYTSTLAASTWALAPVGVVSGNTMTFSVTEGGNVDAAGGTDLAINAVGVAKRGNALSQPMIPVHDMWWAGTAENGWGLSMAQSTDGNVFAAIYAYDDAGKPTWWVMPTVTWDYGRGSFEERLYSTLGTPWSAYDARYVIVSKAGSARFSIFAGGNTAALDYGINGVTGRKLLERQVFGAPDSRAVPNVNGMWWGGQSQNGWGISIVQQNATLFMVWFTYDETMKPTWFVLPGGAWTGTNTYEGRIYKTHGSPWLGRAYDASKFVVTDAGPYRLTFNGTSATMAYTLDGRTGNLALVRQAPF